MASGNALIRSFGRLADRIRQPTGLTVVVVGPDGAGKSSLASSLIDQCGVFFWKTRHLHWRPGLLPRLGAMLGRPRVDTDAPHSPIPHGPTMSRVVLLYYWLDFLLGTWLKLRPLQSRSTLIVLERGWWDILVDPRRYRLQVSDRLISMLGRLLPTPDLTLLLDAPPSLFLQRKQELPSTELERQSKKCRELVVRLPHSRLDASRSETDVQVVATEEVVTFLEQRTAARMGRGWVTLPRAGEPRWMIPRGPRSTALSGLRIHQPMTPIGRLAWEAARVAALAGGFSLLPRGHARDCAIPTGVRAAHPASRNGSCDEVE